MTRLSDINILSIVIYAVSIVVGLVISYVLIILSGYLTGLILSIIKSKKIRMIGSLTIIAVMYYSFIKFNMLSVGFCLYSVLLFLLVLRTENKTEIKIKSGKYKYKGFAYADTYLRWGTCILAMTIVPVLIKVPERVCLSIDIKRITWLKFYWAYNDGIWSVVLIRMTIICIIFMLSAFSIILALLPEELEVVTENKKNTSKINLKKDIVALIKRKTILLDKKDYSS